MREKHSRWLLACVALVICPINGATSWAQAQPSETLLFESFEGTFVSVKSTSLKIKTADGDKIFRLAKPGEDLQHFGAGRGTAISVSGIDRASFLKNSMTIRFVAELDNTGKSVKPLESIEVLSISDKLDTLKERISDADPQSGVASYRFTARIQLIDRGANRLRVFVRDGSKSERFDFLTDADKTRVSYDLPELSLAQPGESILVRCFPLPGENQVASEVRVTRPSPFADNPTLAAADAPKPLVDPSQTPENKNPNQTVVSNDSEAGDEEVATAPNENAMANDAPAPRAKSGEAEQLGDAVEFDFAAPVPNASEIDRGLIAFLLGVEMVDPHSAAMEVPVRPRRNQRRTVLRGNLPARGWYKIN